MYIVSNFFANKEVRISNEELDGNLIYKGHKLGIPDNILSTLLYHRHDRSRNEYHFLDYQKWKDIYNFEKLTPVTDKCWFRNSDTHKALLESYDTLLKSLKDINGDFKNIYVVEI